MRPMLRRRLLLVACFGALAANAGLSVAAPSAHEQARIERLIRHVETQKGIVFIRNGTEYGGDEAARFLRGKMDTMGADVNSARDFIERIATRSSTTGKAYQVRLSDGRVIPAAQFLSDELKRLDAHPA